MKLEQQKTPKIFAMSFASVYKLYITKVERKNRTKEELDTVIYWLTGYDKDTLDEVLKNKTNFVDFYNNAPAFNPKCIEIKAMICGYRIEEVQNPVMRKIRYLDKLVDELAKGKKMDKILRS